MFTLCRELARKPSVIKHFGVVYTDAQNSKQQSSPVRMRGMCVLVLCVLVCKDSLLQCVSRLLHTC
jgi:hypothetical protein